MQTDPVKYLAETRAILGEPFNHDDSVNDRTKGSKLSNASQLTSNLWKETFGEEFRRPGRILSKIISCFNVNFAISRLYVQRRPSNRSIGAIII